MNKQPFDLVRAIRGEPVVTRDGRIAVFADTPLVMSVKDESGGASTAAYTLDGKFLQDREEPLDLFMAAPERSEPFDVDRFKAGDVALTANEFEVVFVSFDEKAEPWSLVGKVFDRSKVFCDYVIYDKQGSCRFINNHDLVAMKPKAPKTRRMELWVRARPGIHMAIIERAHTAPGDDPMFNPNVTDWLSTPIFVCEIDEPIKEQS